MSLLSCWSLWLSTDCQAPRILLVEKWEVGVLSGWRLRDLTQELPALGLKFEKPTWIFQRRSFSSFLFRFITTETQHSHSYYYRLNMITFLSVSLKQDLLCKIQTHCGVRAFFPNRFENLINSSDKSQQVPVFWSWLMHTQVEKVKKFQGPFSQRASSLATGSPKWFGSYVLFGSLVGSALKGHSENTDRKWFARRISLLFFLFLIIPWK